ncbi:hypothetical protein [Parerythrobacter jejuensis]|uniref:Uncharacterized protein n=1 Tax=Parerythrobacter jejuensis TaxID=795812 RepID=A0A845AXZ6_9SPHN|nr:hypothetical protein [Parerythrobacter jejuensis]MXP30616.1 hypothetical protein [Parerythrobacter jejuensis]MXP33376.1 hypothetical protein [Parerythrobacter jejuensis]
MQGPLGILPLAPDLGSAPTPGLLTSYPAPQTPPAGEPAPAQRPLETLIESLVTARESGKIARGDMVLRHAEFGTVTVQVDHAETDLKATLSSRDPGFAPAAKAALADRAHAAPTLPDASQTQARGQDPGSGAMTQRDTGMESQQDRNHPHGSHPGHGGPEEASQLRSDPDSSPFKTSLPSSPSDRGLLA